MQLCLLVVFASPWLSMPIHAVRATFLKPLRAYTCMETQGAMTTDRGSWILVISFFCLPVTWGINRRIVTVAMLRVTSPAHWVLVRVKGDNICQVLSMSSSSQRMTVMRMTMMKKRMSFRIHLFSVLPVPYHTTLLHGPCNLVAMTVTSPQTLPSLSQHLIFSHVTPFACPYLILLSKLFLFFQKCYLESQPLRS